MDKPIKKRPPAHTVNNGNNISPTFAADVAAIINKHNQGRMAEITPEKYAKVVDAIRNGEMIIEACKNVGISPAAFYRLKQLQPSLQEVVAPAHETGLSLRVDTSLKKLTDLDVASMEHKEGLVQIRHKEASYKATMDYASRLDGITWGSKNNNLNVNVNVEAPPEVDVSMYLNR